MREKLNEGIVKDLKVCAIKPFFDFLQKRELNPLGPIDVTDLIDLTLLVRDSLPKIFLWNQISDTNLGIHDYVDARGEATFTNVVVNGEILPIQDFISEGRNPSEVELVHVMNNAHKAGKSISYFVAEGIYNGVDGVHFCLIPFNDQLSCGVIGNLFGEKFVSMISELEGADLERKMDGVNLDDYLDTDAIPYCQDLYLEHFQKTLKLVPMEI